MAKKDKHKRAQRRKVARAAKRRRREEMRGREAVEEQIRALQAMIEGQRVHFVGSYSGEHEGLYDDCPWCRAMRDVGIVPDANGVAVVEPEQQRAYEARAAEIIAAEGMPEGAARFEGDDIVLRHELAVRTMTAEGWPDDPQALAPDRRKAFYSRYSELLRGAHEGPSMN